MKDCLPFNTDPRTHRSADGSGEKTLKREQASFPRPVSSSKSFGFHPECPLCYPLPPLYPLCHLCMSHCCSSSYCSLIRYSDSAELCSAILPFPQQEVNYPTAANVRARLTAVLENALASTAGFLQGIPQLRYAVEILQGINGLGQFGNCGTVPG
jgi:hypothetical protein